MKRTLADRIVAMEWAMFQDTANEGGRAPCQDDFRSFDIMRRSQRGAAQGDTAFDAYLEGELQTFSAATLRLYLEYLRHCGRNHVTAVLENIARMRGYASLEEADARVGQTHF